MFTKTCTKEEFMANPEIKKMIANLKKYDISNPGYLLLCNFLYRNAKLCSVNPDEVFKDIGMYHTYNIDKKFINY